MKMLLVKYLKNVFEKSKGLLGAKKPYPVYFQTRFGIHTFGMKFPIDVLILNHDKMVVKLVKNLPPNRLFFWNPQYYNVVELPGGIIKSQKIKLKTKIMLSCFKT
jgi:uncharacterized protein